MLKIFLKLPIENESHPSFFQVYIFKASLSKLIQVLVFFIANKPQGHFNVALALLAIRKEI